ncbi:MAG: thiol protease/hemagglutinin PrtT [Bacteroidaceae bacterium]
MKRNRFFPLVGLLLLTCSMSASPVDVSQAKAAAQHFLHGVYPSTNVTRATTSDLALVYTDASTASKTRTANAPATYYVFNTTCTPGFVVVAGDDAASPILGYSTEQGFQVGEMPENVQHWLNGYQAQIRWAREHPAAVSTEAATAWQTLREGTFEWNSDSVQLETAWWGQQTPYNELCPTIKGEKTVTGCTATAMAMIMNYHQWPEMGEGDYSYTTRKYKLKLSTTFDVPYAWKDLRLTYKKGEYTPAQATQVATLMYHCGVATQMNYGIPEEGGSDAYSYDALRGLIHHLKYDKAARLLKRNFYTTTEWHALMQDELKGKRPIFYAGYNNEGGHSFILDGYKANDYYHVNWGANGNYNGYFLLEALNLSNGLTYNLNQEAGVGIRPVVPNSTYRNLLYYQAGQVNGAPFKGISTTEPKLEIHQEFVVKVGLLVNYGLSDFKGRYGVALLDKDGNRKEFISELHNATFSGYTSDSFTCTITKDLAPGDRLRLLYQSSDAQEWDWVKGNQQTVEEIVINNPTAIERVEPMENATVTLEQLDNTVQIRSTEPMKQIALYPITGGPCVQQQTVSTTVATLSLSELPAGLYLLNVTTAKGSRRYKISKK